MSLTLCLLNIIFLIFQKNITLNLKNDKLTEDLKVTRDREERVVSEAKEFAVKSSKTKEELFAKLSEAYEVKWLLFKFLGNLLKFGQTISLDITWWERKSP